MNKDINNVASSQQAQQQNGEERFKHFWETKKSSGNGMKMNYIWHSRQFFFALVPSLAVILVGEIMRRKLKAVQNMKDGGAVPLADNEANTPLSALGAADSLGSPDAAVEPLTADELQRRSERQQLEQSVASLQAQLDELKRGLAVAPSSAVGSPIEQRNVHRMQTSKTGAPPVPTAPTSAANSNTAAAVPEDDKAAKLTAAVLSAMGAAAGDLSQTLRSPSEAAGKLVEWAGGVLGHGLGEQRGGGGEAATGGVITGSTAPSVPRPADIVSTAPGRRDTMNDAKEVALGTEPSDDRGTEAAATTGGVDTMPVVEAAPKSGYPLTTPWFTGIVEFYRSWWTWSGSGESSPATGTVVPTGDKES